MSIGIHNCENPFECTVVEAVIALSRYLDFWLGSDLSDKTKLKWKSFFQVVTEESKFISYEIKKSCEIKRMTRGKLQQQSAVRYYQHRPCEIGKRKEKKEAQIQIHQQRLSSKSVVLQNSNRFFLCQPACTFYCWNMELLDELEKYRIGPFHT